MSGKPYREFVEVAASRASGGRGVDVLLKKAAVDAAFRKLLLEKRGAAAQAIGLELDAAEAAIIDAVPESQLDAVIARTAVSPKIRPAFLGYAAGVMLAALAATTSGCAGPLSPATEGIRPDPPVPPPGTAEPAPSQDDHGAAAVPDDASEIDREVNK
jgi:hypothetical protein